MLLLHLMLYEGLALAVSCSHRLDPTHPVAQIMKIVTLPWLQLLLEMLVFMSLLVLIGKVD